jgi:hypothetical protein
LINRGLLVPAKPLRALNREEERMLFQSLGKVAEAISRLKYKNYDLVPMYHGDDTDFLDGTTLAYQAAFRSIPEVIEEQVEWDQIVAFRDDHDAATKYRALRTWLRDGLRARSVDEATDIIAEKLRHYETAMEKYGLKTMIGCIKMLYDAQFLSQLAGISGTLGAMFGPVAAAVGGGLYVAGKVWIELSERRIELIDAQQGNQSEVAIIYEANRLART